MRRESSRASAAPEAGAGPYEIGDREFSLFQALVQRETGIQLPETKRLLLVGRLARRLRALQLGSFGEYYRRVLADGDELVRMVDLVSTNETQFFREPKQFEFIERTLLPALAAGSGETRRRLRVWSAACSTGEEPYSIGMLLLAQLPGWQLEILATDLSTRVLEKARAAVWPIEKSREIPEQHLKAFMLRGVGEHQGYMKAGPELRALVRFERLNLHAERYGLDGAFDLIFCRNVLIYFSAEGRASVVSRLLSHLAPTGRLFLGHAETLNGITNRLHGVGPSAYAWTQRSPSPTGSRPAFPGRAQGRPEAQ